MRRSDAVVSTRDAIVSLVRADRRIGSAETERPECVLLPRLALATVALESYPAELVVEAAHEAAGVDLGKLPVVADEDDLGVVALGGIEERGEGAGAGHGRFVDDEHSSGWKPFRAARVGT